MDTLQSIFPLVPIAALERVLDICDQSVEAASDWLLENDWQELIDEEDEQDGAQADHFEEDGRGEIQAVANGTNTRLNGDGQEHVAHAATTGGAFNALARVHAARAAVASPASSNGEPRGLTMAVSTESTLARATNLHSSTAAAVVHDQQHRHHQHQHHHHRHGRHHQGEGGAGADLDGDSEDGDEEDEDEDDDDDDDDDDEDDGDGNSYYDSGDDSYFHNSMPPLAKRVKVSRDEKTTNLESSEHFWASFDGQVVPKTLIELLNTTLTKLAHSSVMLLKKSSKQITEDEARDHLKSVLVRADEVAVRSNDSLDNNNHIQPGNLLSRILNAAPPDAAPEEPAHAGQKRKRVEETTSPTPMGFFAHFFSISDLDMVWRSMLHAHVFNGRFGDLIEFHAASSGVFARRDFDELMHIHTNVSSSSRSASMGAASLAGLKCCLLLPCEATEEEIFRVGKHLHTLLKLPGSLYYRTLDVVGSESAGSNRDSSPADLLNEDGKLTEESFRRFARYRIKKEEVEATEAKNEKEAMGPDHFLAYQQQRKVDHCLQLLEKDSWVQRVSG